MTRISVRSVATIASGVAAAAAVERKGRGRAEGGGIARQWLHSRLHWSGTVLTCVSGRRAAARAASRRCEEARAGQRRGGGGQKCKTCEAERGVAFVSRHLHTYAQTSEQRLPICKIKPSNGSDHASGKPEKMAVDAGVHA